MARHKRESEGVSLFPFMSILVALIGSLTLMITALMASQSNEEQSPEAVAQYARYTQLQAEMDADRQELENLKLLLASAEELQKRVRAAADEAALLEQTQQDQMLRVDPTSEYARMLAEANMLRKRVAEIQGEPARLDQELAGLEAEVKRRKAGPEEAIVQIRSGGSGVDIAPTFVECTSTGIVIHEGDEPARILTVDIPKEDGDFRALLDRVSATPKGEVIFLVRPDAVGVYNAARNIAREHYGPNGYTRNGKLPVPTLGKLDLSVFRK